MKGIDLSFDINSYTDASGVNTRTDYSYRAAKSLFNNRVKVVIGGSLSPDDYGEITQTGVGFVVKKRLLNLMELFRPRKSRKGVNL